MLTRQPWLEGRAVAGSSFWTRPRPIKNPSTRQSRAVRRLPASARIALTGTPVENRLTDLWALFDFLNPGLLGSRAVFAGFVKGAAGARRASVRAVAPARRGPTSCGV